MYYATTIASCFALCVFLFFVFSLRQFISIHISLFLRYLLSRLLWKQAPSNDLIFNEIRPHTCIAPFEKARTHRAGSEIVTFKICRNFANVELFSWKYVLGFFRCHRCVRLWLCIILLIGKYETRQSKLFAVLSEEIASPVPWRKHHSWHLSRVQEHRRTSHNLCHFAQQSFAFSLCRRVPKIHTNFAWLKSQKSSPCIAWFMSKLFPSVSLSHYIAINIFVRWLCRMTASHEYAWCRRR